MIVKTVTKKLIHMPLALILMVKTVSLSHGYIHCDVCIILRPVVESGSLCLTNCASFKLVFCKFPLFAKVGSPHMTKPGFISFSGLPCWESPTSHIAQVSPSDGFDGTSFVYLFGTSTLSF